MDDKDSVMNSNEALPDMVFNNSLVSVKDLFIPKSLID